MKKLDEIIGSPGRYTFSCVAHGSEALVLSEVVRKSGESVLYVALDDASMEEVVEALAFFSPKLEVLSFPAWDSIPYDRVSPNNNIVSQRVRSLTRLSRGDFKGIVVTTVNALIQKVVPAHLLKETTFHAKEGDKVNRDDLASFLVGNAYVNTATVREPGEFAFRGSIVDIFAPGEEKGFRLDFFGDQLETIRSFDPLTQVSGSKVSKVELVPASEIILDEESIVKFRNNYRTLFGAVTKDDPLYHAISEGRKYAGMENWLPLFYDKLDTLFDYLPNAVIGFSHLAEESFKERSELIKDSYETRVAHTGASFTSEVSYNPVPPEQLYLDEGCLDKISDRVLAFLSPFAVPAETNEVLDFGYSKTNNFSADSKQEQQNAFDLVKRKIESIAQNKKALIACMSEGSRSRFEVMLLEHEIPFKIIDSWQEVEKLNKGLIGLVLLKVESGFETSDLILITEQDILGEKIYRSSARKKKSEKFLSEASSISEGELVVHRNHGIGRFEGLEGLSVNDKVHDCLKLIYADGDRLFVPVENLDLITRYGAEDGSVVLDKLGGVSWQERTAKLKNRIKVTAEELLNVAAKRAVNQSSVFYPQDSSYEEFCARFPFVETEDQRRTIEEIVADLGSDKPMDRLVCGDVGFGKTEVALRAAFVVTHPEDGREKGQVGIVTPTTLLCRQHYQTFVDRFSATKAKIRQLSRLESAKDQRETKEMIESGEVDIVVGTHALFADNIEFKNLSLLIIDEEQHFGVSQKEKLKKLRASTNVITLTATPIPRTLQLSMSGIRDLSIIATPPIDRLAVRTYVMPYDPVVIREAILREHYRGGRTFYVCPRIKDLEDVEEEIKKLVPEVKVVTAHGRMSPAKLDQIMNAFYDGSYDVLLSTTIVESGLDIPTANTIIIHRSDMYGLSQLYQLRGRVGRSKVRAYAYLTLPPKKIPTKQAVKRLEVMQKLDNLGAGFSLASHDMDIRGFGNLLGDEQSGNIKEVGAELYQSMLKEAIEGLKFVDQSGNISKEFSTQINVGISVFIPEVYIADLELRMGLYRRIANLESKEEIEEVAVELVDRFGPIPKEVENLLAVVKIKQICQRLGIDRLEVGPKGAVLGFYKDRFVNPEALIGFIASQPDRFKIRSDQKLVMMNQNWQEVEERLKGISESLNDISRLAA